MSVDSFKWGNDKFNFFEGFIETFGENSDKEHIFEVVVDYPKKQKIHSKTYHSYQKEREWTSTKSLFVIFITIKNT